MISDSKKAYQQEKGRIPITACQDKKCNKIGMVVAGFFLQQYNEFWGDRTGDIVVADVPVDCAAAEV